MSQDLAFYDAGCDKPLGPRGLIVPFRRVLRRVQRPFFQRLVAILQSHEERLDTADRSAAGLRGDVDRLQRSHRDLAEQSQAALSFGWDYVAMTRRIAALEDRVESLTAQLEAQRAGTPGNPAAGRVSVPFPAAQAPKAEAC